MLTSIQPLQAASTLSDDLAWVLVGFLFASVIAEVVGQAARLIDQRRTFRDSLPAISHLILVTAVVTTSWIGWSRGIATQGQHLELVFSWPYVSLFTDLGLLTCYFIMAKKTGIPDSKDEPLRPCTQAASFWLMLIFWGYLVWDLLNRWLIEGHSEYWWYLQTGRGTIFYASAVTIAWAVLRHRRRPTAIAAGNGALLLLVFLYRAINQFGFPWIIWLGTPLLAVSVGLAFVLDREEPEGGKLQGLAHRLF